MSSTFVSKFIRDMTSKGFDDPEQIILEAKKEIVDIDEKLRLADELRVRRMNLYSVLSFYGEKSTTPTSRFFEAEYNDNSETAKELQRKILALLEKEGSITNTAIFAALQTPVEERKATVQAIKYLGELQIVKWVRNEGQEKRLVQGPEWNKSQEV